MVLSLWKSLPVSYNVNHTLTIWPYYQDYPGYLPKINENICSQRDFIHKREKLVTTQVFLNRWMDKLIVVCSYSGISVNNKKKWTADKCNSLDESQNHGEQKKINKKENMLYDSIYVRFYKRKKQPKVINQVKSVDTSGWAEDGCKEAWENRLRYWEGSLSGLWCLLLGLMHSSKLVSLYTLNGCILLYIN